MVADLLGRFAGGSLAAAAAVRPADPLVKRVGWAAWREWHLLRREVERTLTRDSP
jgi:hypothetical protein